MPWKETCALEERLKLMIDVQDGRAPLAELCRAYGISRPTAYKWLRRYDEEGAQGLQDRPRVPRHCPHAVDGDTIEAIVMVRKRFPSWGPKKIKALLEEEQPGRSWPAASTMGTILDQYGLTVPRKRRRRTEPYTEPFKQCERPNDVWCVDYKGWFRTGDGQRCEPLTLTDAHTRYVLRCEALPGTDGALTMAVLQAAFRQYGLPRAIRSDNGHPFASVAPRGLSKLSIWWLKLGIIPERIEPGKPQQNGRHERFHLTLKQETASPPKANVRAQQRAFHRFQKRFNHQRPHEALGQRPPASCYEPSPRTYPARIPEVAYPSHMEIRRVEKKGQITWRGSRIFLSEALAGEPVGLDPLDDRYYHLYFATWPLAIFDTYRLEMLRGPDAEKIHREITESKNDFCPSSGGGAKRPRARGV